MNIVCQIGNLGQDPEIKQFETGACKVSFSIAQTIYVKDKDPRTIWIPCEAWGQTAELITTFFKKGQKIGLEGKWDVSEWEENGQKRSRAFLKVERITFCEKADGAQRTQVQSSSAPKPTSNNSVAPEYQNPDYGEVEIDEDLIDEDEIPF